MNPKDKAIELIRVFAVGRWCIGNAKTCVEVILADLSANLEIAKELHPHTEGLIAGSLVYWQSVKQELEELT